MNDAIFRFLSDQELRSMGARDYWVRKRPRYGENAAYMEGWDASAKSLPAITVTELL